jgi:hypothetical protein
VSNGFWPGSGGGELEGPAQRDDLCGRGVQSKIELELALACRQQRANDAAERQPLVETVVGLLDDRQIGKREERIGIGPMHRTQDAAFHQISQVILAKRPIADEQIAHRVVLPFQGVRRSARLPAGRTPLRENADGALRRGLRVQFLGAFELVALLFGRRTESFTANDEHRRPRVDVVGGGAAEPSHERARFLASERAEFSSENDELSREWQSTRQAMRG